MSTKPEPAIIPKEASAEYKSWSLPAVDQSKGVISCEKHGAGSQRRHAASVRVKRAATGTASASSSNPQKKPNSDKKPAPANTKARPAEGEIIEDVAAGDFKAQPFTAEQLQEITDAAEQEGFKKGHQEGVAAGRTEGKKLGYDEGLQQGRDTAAKESARTLTQQVANLTAIAEQLIEPITSQSQQLEQTLLGLVTALTRQLVMRELTTEPADILAVVHEALAALPVGAGNIRLTLNPDDLAVVETYAQETLQDWQFVGDSSLMPGGCRVQTRESLVDFTVETRLAALLEQFVSRQLVADTGPVEAADEHETVEQQAAPDSALNSSSQSSRAGDSVDE